MDSAKSLFWRSWTALGFVLAGCGTNGTLVQELPAASVSSRASAKLGDVTVSLIAICDRELGSREMYNSPSERSWRSDGSPYGIRDNGAGIPPVSRPSEGMSRVRYLTFSLASPTTKEVDVYGFVPGAPAGSDGHPELHGRDVPTRITIFANGAQSYRIPIAVENPKSDRYEFGVASGVSKTIWTTTTVPAVSSKPTGAVHTVGKGTWGTLRMTEPSPIDSRQASFRTLPGITFEIVNQPEPKKEAYEIRLLDKSGATLVTSIIQHPERAQIRTQDLARLGRIEITSRPYQFVVFRDVHFDPDPTKWGETYWGEEGRKAVSVSPGVGDFVGIVRPTISGTGWTECEFFAADGKRWREYPIQSSLDPHFSTSDWPKGEVLVGLLQLRPQAIANGGNVRAELYASTSPTPGEGVGKLLKSLVGLPFTREVAQIAFSRPDTPYVQVKLIPSSSNWQVVGEVAPPAGPFVRFTPSQLADIRKGVNAGVMAVTLILRSDHSLAFFCNTPSNPNDLREKLVPAAPANTETRLMARLKNGQLEELFSNGGSSVGDTEFIFYLDKESEPVLDANGRRVRLSEIDRLVVQRRGFGKPTFVAAKLPPAFR